MKPIILSQRQLSVLMNLGLAIEEAMTEFRGRTVADVTNAARSAYAAAVVLSLPSVTPPRREPVARKVKKAKPKTTKTAGLNHAIVEKRSRVVKLLSSSEFMPSGVIAKKLKVPVMGFGALLHRMNVDGMIAKKKVDGVTLWGPKSVSKANGTAHATST